MNKPTNASCPGMEAELAAMLLDDAPDARIRAHVEACDGCRAELAELRATMNLMDDWEAPEPNPYFMTRFGARLREERAQAPVGWLSRLRAGFSFGAAGHARPLAAMALTVLLLVGGGTYMSLNDPDQPTQNPQPAPQAAAVVHDLQNLDSNAQLLDQLESLSNNNDNGE